jgi:transposase
MDETDIKLFPHLRKGLAIKGKEALVPISGKNDKRVLYGAINIKTGHRLWFVRENLSIENFKLFLDTVRYHYRKFNILLILDENSTHTSPTSQAHARRRNIKLAWLPLKSPKLNPVDHLWKHGRNDISADLQYDTIDEHVFRFIHYLDGFSNKQALKKAGLLSKDFWLYRSMEH